MPNLSKHANDITFTEESLVGFIKKIHNNIRDNLMFASTSDMAENGINTEAEQEIASNFNDWATTYAAKICIINTEYPIDLDNLNNGRYTWIRGGSLLNFETELSNDLYNKDTRPDGTIYVDENNGTKKHVISIKGFDGYGNFSNRVPSNSLLDNPPSGREQWKYIVSNILKADEVGTVDEPITDAYIKNLHISSNGNFISDGDLVINSDSEAYRIRDTIRTYDVYTNEILSEDYFADSNLITNIPYYIPPDPTYTVENVDGANYGFELIDDYYQSQNTSVNTAALCKLSFSTEFPATITLAYQNTGYSTYNYSLFSRYNTDLKTTYAADNTNNIALKLSNDFHEEDTYLEFNIPEGETYITIKHRIGTTPSSTKPAGFIKFKIISMTPITNPYPNNTTLFTGGVQTYGTYNGGTNSNGGLTNIQEKQYYIQTDYNRWQSCKPEDYYNYDTQNILHTFTGGDRYDYIGDGSVPLSDGTFEAYTANYNMYQPRWQTQNNRMYVRILNTNEIKNSYEENELLYVSYNQDTKSFEYYQITNAQPIYYDLDEETTLFTGMSYTFSLIQTPENINSFSDPGEAILFTTGVDSNTSGGSAYAITTFYIDDQSYTGADSSVLPRFAVVQKDLIPNVTILNINGGETKYLNPNADISNLFVKENESYIPVELGVDYTDQVNNFYRQTSQDNLAELLAEDPLLGEDGTDPTKPMALLGSIRTNGGIAAKKSIKGFRVHAAVFNDYAEYRMTDYAQPGTCVIETGTGNMIVSSTRLQPGANIVSDTFGFSIGETPLAQTPIAVCGRVLAYPFENKEIYEPGDAVCSGPNGTISKMTREEIKEWPDRIVGYVSEIPTYEYWGSDKVEVNGRIWIKIK